MKCFIFLVPIFILGCVNLDEMSDEERTAYFNKKEDFKYQREEDLIEAREKFYMRQAVCKKKGGVMVIPRQERFERHGMPTRETKRDYMNAACARW